MPVEHQVAAIYAVSNGYLDHIEVPRIKPWEHGFHQYLDERQGELLGEIREQKTLSDELAERLVSVIEEYNKEFAAKEGIEEPAAVGA
jgi:F-type H+-transporting ATPase subunit alpha